VCYRTPYWRLLGAKNLEKMLRLAIAKIFVVSSRQQGESYGQEKETRRGVIVGEAGITSHLQSGAFAQYRE
jgi:hypothetical protein